MNQRAQDILDAWRKRRPKEAPKGDVAVVVDAYFPNSYRLYEDVGGIKATDKASARGSHFLLVQDPYLKLAADLGYDAFPGGFLTIPHSGGKLVKWAYLQKLIEAIDLRHMVMSSLKEKEERAMNIDNAANGAEYYLTLRYPAVVRELSPEEGGGYMATIPVLGESTFVADGETATEALEALDSLRRLLIPMLCEQGVVLPEPTAVTAEAEWEKYSGNLLIRIPRQLHCGLARSARRQGCSINQLVTSFLSAGLAGSDGAAAVVAEIERLLGSREVAGDPASRSVRAMRWKDTSPDPAERLTGAHLARSQNRSLAA